MRELLPRWSAWLAVCALAGCTSVVRAPPAPGDPVPVFLLLDARHRGLLLPAADGKGLVEYGFGDWDWYALNEDAWYDVFDTVLWPASGALGRRPTDAADAPSLRARYPWMELHEFAVEREAMEALRGELEAPFAARAADQHFNPRYGMTFVPADDGFWCLFNCNDAAALWLERLGCEVSWVPLRLGLSVKE